MNESTVTNDVDVERAYRELVARRRAEQVEQRRVEAEEAEAQRWRELAGLPIEQHHGAQLSLIHAARAKLEADALPAAPGEAEAIQAAWESVASLPRELAVEVVEKVRLEARRNAHESASKK